MADPPPTTAAAPNLDDDLGIPPDATLNPSLSSADGPTPESNESSAAHATLQCSPTSQPIVIGLSTSIRRAGPAAATTAAGGSAPRSIVVGRQASSADIRIDHGSISRRHAALYYVKKGNGQGLALMLQDLGGKHGTYVDGQRMDKKSTLEVRDGNVLVFGNVKEREFVVRLPPSMTAGNVAAAPEHVGGATTGEKKVGDDAHDVPAKETPGSTNNNEDDSHEKPDPFEGLSGRERREAEIKAMMESLDENPAYQKYSAPPDPEGANEEVPIGQKSNANGGSKAPVSSALNAQTADNNNIGSAGAKLGLPVTKTAPFASSASAVPTPSDPRPGGGRALSALSLDPAGSRLVTGCTDTNLRLYDFNGMDADQKAFREVTIEEGHPITSLCHSNTGDRMLVGTTSAQPMVVDRDGREVIQFAKGDVYMTDMSKTIGHTATVTDVAWHPLEKDKVMTASIDGSARMWNLSSGKTAFKKLKCDLVYRAKNSKGIRTAVTACAFHPSGREICLGTADGSIQIWDATRVKPRPDKVIYDAHGTGNAICYVGYSYDGKRLVSRSSDDTTAKVWEARRLSRSSRPILIAAGLPSLFDGSNCAFSPDGKFLVAGTSVEPPRKKDGGRNTEARGTIRFYRVPAEGSAPSSSGPQDALLDLEAAAQGASIVKVAWHHKLNQIFVAASDGNCRVFYDESLSKKGSLLSTTKGAKRKDDLSMLLESRAPQGSFGLGADKIIAPHSLPMYRDEKLTAGKRKREELKDPVKSKRPQAPEGGVKIGGQTSASVNFTQFVVKSTIKNKNIAGKDPREELFKYSQGKSFASKAYEGDQERVLATKTAEQEEEEMKSKKK